MKSLKTMLMALTPCAFEAPEGVLGGGAPEEVTPETAETDEFETVKDDNAAYTAPPNDQ